MKPTFKEKTALITFGILFIHLGCFHASYLAYGPSLGLLETTQWSYMGWIFINIITLILEFFAGIMFLGMAFDI